MDSTQFDDPIDAEGGREKSRKEERCQGRQQGKREREQSVLRADVFRFSRVPYSLWARKSESLVLLNPDVQSSRGEQENSLLREHHFTVLHSA